MRRGGVRSGIQKIAPEVIHPRGPWRNFEAVEFATLEWADWFTNCRLLEPIGNILPALGGGSDSDAAMGFGGDASGYLDCPLTGAVR